jgi:pilus assembly protein CpaE
LAEALAQGSVDALYVELGFDPDTVLEAVARLVPPRPLLLLSGPSEDGPLLLRCMRLGAREFFQGDPDESELRDAIERLLLEHSSQAPPREGRVLAVLGSKGGIGATTVACQLAAELQRHGPTAIVDLDVASGDVALYFDLAPRFSLSDLRGEGEGLDATYLRTLLEAHECGVRVLAAPDRVEERERLELPNLNQALNLLRSEFAWVVLDVARSWTETSLRALESADQILLITSFGLAALKHAHNQMEVLAKLGLSNRVRLVANRQSPQEALTMGDVTRFLKRRPDVCLPNDFQATSSSIDQGRPLTKIAANAPLTRSYETLASRLHEWCEVPLRETEIQQRKWSRMTSRLAQTFRRGHVAD